MNATHDFVPRAELLPFHRPSITESDMQAVERVMHSRWLTTGPEALAFEQEFATYVGAAHAIAVSSCTAGLHLALLGLGVDRRYQRNEVVVPTLTFTASASEVLHAGGKVVLADVDQVTFNLSGSTVAAVAGPDTRGVVFVHLGGNPSGLRDVRAWAEAQDRSTGPVRGFVLEDAAHALPARVDDWRIGRTPWATVFSFYATKTLTCGEGGMITTDNAELAERLRRLACHGVDRDTYQRSRTALTHYDVVDEGYKCNLPDLLAALGRSQLQRSDGHALQRMSITWRYAREFSMDTGIAWIHAATDSNVRSAWHLFMVALNLDALTITRDQFAEELRMLNIATSVHYRPLHQHTYWRRLLDDGTRVRGPKSFPHADWLYARLLSLPIFPDMTDDDVADVIRTVRHVSRKFRR